MNELTNQDLLIRLRDPEDHFTERKTFNDKDGWLKTAVAFANSAPIGWPAILFVGITSKGAFEAPATNLDEFAKKLSSELSRAYPPIYHLPRVVTDERGDRCLAGR